MRADETFVLTLSNAMNAELADAEATGTIADNDDSAPVAQAWLSRFGRTVAGQVVDTLDGRLRADFVQAPSVTLGGRQLRSDMATADAGRTGYCMASRDGVYTWPSLG